MYRLNVKMYDGNETYRYFITYEDAVEYRDARNMAANRFIARTWIESISFSEWLANV